MIGEAFHKPRSTVGLCWAYGNDYESRKEINPIISPNGIIRLVAPHAKLAKLVYFQID